MALTQPRIVASAGLRADPGITFHMCVVNLGLNTSPPLPCNHTVHAPAGLGFSILWNMQPMFIPQGCGPLTLLKDSRKQRYANSGFEKMETTWNILMVGGFIILPFVAFSFVLFLESPRYNPDTTHIVVDNMF